MTNQTSVNQELFVFAVSIFTNNVQARNYQKAQVRHRRGLENVGWVTQQREFGYGIFPFYALYGHLTYVTFSRKPYSINPQTLGILLSTVLNQG